MLQTGSINSNRSEVKSRPCGRLFYYSANALIAEAEEPDKSTELKK